jgi:hypothetical protein
MIACAENGGRSLPHNVSRGEIVTIVFHAGQIPFQSAPTQSCSGDPFSHIECQIVGINPGIKDQLSAISGV